MTEQQIPDYGYDAAPTDDDLRAVSTAIRALQKAEEEVEEAGIELKLK